MIKIACHEIAQIKPVFTFLYAGLRLYAVICLDSCFNLIFSVETYFSLNLGYS